MLIFFSTQRLDGSGSRERASLRQIGRARGNPDACFSPSPPTPLQSADKPTPRLERRTASKVNRSRAGERGKGEESSAKSASLPPELLQDQKGCDGGGGERRPAGLHAARGWGIASAEESCGAPHRCGARDEPGHSAPGSLRAPVLPRCGGGG